MSTVDAVLAGWTARSEATLDALLPPASQSPQRLHAAMRHAALGGGKRMRPLLVYAAGHCFGAPPASLDHAAAAVELIHAYSLVHDDLPAMDDDDMRRGRPTVHVAFDEATAILAGDALQALAFDLLAQAPLPAERVVAMLGALARGAGSVGMAGGQALDLQAVGQRIDETALATMHALKTGALIRSAVAMGALAAGAAADARARLDDWAAALGLAFQIRDDLLDVEADTQQLGKTAGKDAADGKPTYVSMLGLDGARARLDAQRLRMCDALSAIHGDTAALAALARMAVERRR